MSCIASVKELFDIENGKFQVHNTEKNILDVSWNVVSVIKNIISYLMKTMKTIVIANLNFSFTTITFGTNS